MRREAYSILSVLFLLVSTTVASAQTPGPPTLLSVTPHDDSTVTLQWTPPSTGGAPTGYRVEVGTSSGTSDAFEQTLGLATSYRTSRTFTVGTTYFFRVRAFNGSGVSAASNEVILTIPCPPPSMPQHVSWRPVGSDLLVVWVGTGTSVEFGSSPGDDNVLTSAPTPGRNQNAVQVTLPPGTYYARVVNRSNCSTAEATSPDVIVRSGEPYGSSPVLINELGGLDGHRLKFIELKNVGSDAVNVGNWKLLSGLRAVFFVASLPSGTVLPPGCTYLIGSTMSTVVPAPDLGVPEIKSLSAGLVDPTGRIRDSAAADEDDDDGIPYVFAEGERTRSIASSSSIARVADTDTNNNLADFVFLAEATPQNSSSCTTGGVPTAPSPLSATVNGGTVTLNWMSVATSPPVSQYALEVGLIPGATHFGPFPFGPGQTSVTFSGVPDGTYYARVRASNGNGTSPPTNEVTIVVCWQNCTQPPGAVTQLTFQISGSTVLLAWNPPTTGGAVTGYVLEAGTAPGLSNLGQYPTGSVVPFVIVSGVPPGTYFVRVRAASGSALGPASNEVAIIVQ